MSNWYEQFFIDGWDKVQENFRAAAVTSLEVEFLRKLIRENDYTSVLDVPCGQGRIAVELAVDVPVVCGIDFNPNAIERARNVAEERGVRVQWICGDMREIPFESEFDLVVNMYGSFGYFSDEDNSRFLREAQKSLRNGGMLVIDTHITETVLPIFGPTGAYRMGDVLVVEERRFDIETSRIEVDWTFVQHNQAQTMHSSIRMYSYRELMAMLKEAGFDEIVCYGSINGEPFEAMKSKRMVLTAGKR